MPKYGLAVSSLASSEVANAVGLQQSWANLETLGMLWILGGSSHLIILVIYKWVITYNPSY